MVKPELKFTRSLFLSDWGHMAAIWSEQGLWELSFPQPTIAEALEDLKTPAEALPEHTVQDWIPVLEQDLKLYFRGYPTAFSVPIDWRGYSCFQAAVLKITAGIPYGQLLSYGTVAKAIGNPKAARAVGGALHINRTPIVVPCHRVVGSGGSLTGFGGGLDLKKALLLLENAQTICQ